MIEHDNSERDYVQVLKRMVGRVVLLTGGGGGIARGIARAYASEGAKLILTDLFRKNESSEGRTGKGIQYRGLYNRCRWFQRSTGERCHRRGC